VTAGHDWLEHQYWADVVAVRPDDTIAERNRRSAEVRQGANARLDLDYGNEARQQLDLFVPDGQGPWPLLVFIHGGYWMLGSKDDWAFLAPGWTASGVAVATLGYRLAPVVSLTDIVSDVSLALIGLERSADKYSLDMSRVTVSGISAGAHLAAMQATASNGFRPNSAVLLSGVFDPRPLASTTPGDAVGDSLTSSLENLSPLGRPPPRCPCMVGWGAEETAVFKDQSRLLAHYWSVWGRAPDIVEIEQANHYTVSDSLLADSGSRVAGFILEHLRPE